MNTRLILTTIRVLPVWLVLGVAWGREMELDCVVDGVTLKRGGAAVTEVVVAVEEEEELERSPRTGIPLEDDINSEYSGHPKSS